MEVNCSQCGKIFDRSPSQLKKTNRPYCSRDCYTAAKTFRGFPKQGVTKQCKHCGAEFYVTTGRSNIALFCSRKCKGEGSKKGFRVCKQCGKDFFARGNKSKTIFCSRKCSGAFRDKSILKACKVCNTTFEGSMKSQCCSVDCGNKWQGRNKVEKSCKTCGRDYTISASFLKFGNPSYCSMDCRNNDPAMTQRLIEMNKMQQLGKTTKPERIGYGILDDLEIEYFKQHVIGNKFCVDAFVPSTNTVIQFDGDYWHGNPNRFKDLDERQAKRVKLDKSQDAYMSKCGYKVIRVWESDLLKDPQSARFLLSKAAKASDLSPLLFAECDRLQS